MIEETTFKFSIDPLVQSSRASEFTDQLLDIKRHIQKFLNRQKWEDAVVEVSMDNALITVKLLSKLEPLGGPVNAI